MAHQYDTATPNIHLPACIQSVAHNQLWSRIARTTAASLHEITPPHPLDVYSIQSHPLHELFICQVIFNLLSQFVDWVEIVGETKIGNDNVAVSIEQQVLQLQVTMYDSFLVEVPDARYELGEKSTGSVVLEVSMVQDVVEQLPTGSIL